VAIEGAGAALDVDRLAEQTAALRPEVLQREYDFLKGQHSLLADARWPCSFARPALITVLCFAFGFAVITGRSV
jgi:hypothetical protein